jgi:hypothetical protein
MMNNKSFITSEDSLLAPSLYTAKTQKEIKKSLLFFMCLSLILKRLKIVGSVVGLYGLVVSIPACKPQGA